MFPVSSNPGYFTLGRAWRDGLAAVAVLWFLNFVLAPDDMGWLGLNPSPWIVVPLVMGTRHGFRWGFLSGAVVSGGLLVAWGSSQTELMSLPGFLLLALPGVGLLAGEVREALEERQRQREVEMEALVQLQGNLGSVGLAGGVQGEGGRVFGNPDDGILPVQGPANGGFQVQAGGKEEVIMRRETAALGSRTGEAAPHEAAAEAPEKAAGVLEQTAPVFVLEERLRGLFQPGAGPVFEHLLRLLAECSGVREAAVYGVTEDGPLVRSALRGSAESLPERLLLEESDIARVALARQSLVTCRRVLSTVPAKESPWLAALPWPSGDGEVRHLLLIGSMDPSAVNPENFGRIQLICRWAAAMLEWRGLDGLEEEPSAGPLVVDPEQFRRAAAHAAASRREHQLASSIVPLRLAPGSTAEQAARLLMLVVPQLRTTDVATQHPDGSLEVLLYLDGAEAAEEFRGQVWGLVARDPMLQHRLPQEVEKLAEAA